MPVCYGCTKVLTSRAVSALLSDDDGDCKTAIVSSGAVELQKRTIIPVVRFVLRHLLTALSSACSLLHKILIPATYALLGFLAVVYQRILDVPWTLANKRHVDQRTSRHLGKATPH
jgi:hypothetical protein